MNIRTALIGLACIALAGSAQGQWLEIDDGETTYIYRSVDYGITNIAIGIDNSENGLKIYDDVTVLAVDVVVGYAASSSNNWMALEANAYLQANGTLLVGYDSAGNTLEIKDGAWAYSTAGMLGGTVTANGNQATVTGSDSAWTVATDLDVGFKGDENSLQISNEAYVYADALWIGTESSAESNSVEVSDATLDVGSILAVGTGGSENRLEVSDGAQVASLYSYVGALEGADNNSVSVWGSGSVWTNYGGLYIGTNDNTGNMVSVSDGGEIVLYNGLFIEGSGNGFDLNQNGRLTVHSDFDASMGGFNFNDGGQLYVAGTLTGMTNSIEDGRTLAVFSEAGLWDMSGSDLSVGAVSSSNSLYITDGAQVMAGSLVVGSATNSGNTVEVSGGARLTIEDALTIQGTGNDFNLGNGGWLVISNDFDAGQTGFNFLSGGTLETSGNLTGLNGSIEDARTVYLTGAEAAWNLGTNALYVGTSSSSNTLHLSDGAQLSSSGAVIGGSGNLSNQIILTGTGSAWTNSGNLTVEGSGSLLLVQDGTDVDAGQTLSIQDGALLTVDSGGHLSASSYYQDATSTLAFDSATNSAASPVPELVSVDGTAEFEAGATLQYTGSIGDLGIGTANTNLLVAADTLIVGGVTNATGDDLEVLNTTSNESSLVSIELYSSDDDLYSLMVRARLAESAGFEEGSDMAAVSDEIDQLASGGEMTAETQLGILGGLDSAEQNSQLSQLYDRNIPTYAHAQGMLEGLGQIRNRSVMPDVYWPIGAYGPHLHGDQVQGWIKGYGNLATRSGADSYSGYDQTIYGVVAGADKAFGNLLAGAAGGYATSDISQNDGDSSTAETVYGVLYASWGTTDWFGDLNLGYGRSAIDTKSGTAFDTSAEFDANQLAFYLGGGKELAYRGDRLFLTPSAALLGSYYGQEGYTETATTAVGRVVDEYDRWSMQSELGLKASYHMVYDRLSLVPETHLKWLHEFSSDEQSVDYSLIGGSGGQYTFGMTAPVEDLIEAGLGLSFWSKGKKGRVYELSFGIDGRFGDGYTAGIFNGRLLCEF